MTPLTLTVAIAMIAAAVIAQGIAARKKQAWHGLLEGKPLAMTILVLVAILAGGVAELVPSIVIRQQIPLEASNLEDGGTPIASAPADDGFTGAERPVFSTPFDPKFVQTPYSPLELEGRDVYVREGCYVCHSQMIRPFRHETLRYGDYSRAEEFLYDRPFQWARSERVRICTASAASTRISGTTST